MPIPLETLRRASTRPKPTPIAKSLHEATARAQTTAFLCHSHKDRDLAQGLQVLLAEEGWEVYVDWQDTTMPPEPNKETASAIKKKIIDDDWFLFLATPNSTKSLWCPWEIGFADSVKSHDRIVLLTTSDSAGWYGNEYLQLYRELTIANDNRLGLFPAGKSKGGVSIAKLA